jgi:hypothetical protein
MTKGDGVKRGVRVEWQPSDYLGRVHADIIFGGGYPASPKYLLSVQQFCCQKELLLTTK